MFNALCERRNIRFKHDRYAAGMVAASVYNCARASKDAPLITAFDFVRSAEDAEARAEIDKIKALIKKVVGAMPSDTPMAKLQDVRNRTIASLKAQGRQDAEQLFSECWPSLTPKE